MLEEGNKKVLEKRNKIHFEGQPGLVFGELKKRRDNLLNGIEDNTRPMLMVLGGILRGCYGGGGVIALKEMGFTETFKTVVGLSTGAPTVAYFLSGQPEIGTSIYSEECLSEKFIHMTPQKIVSPNQNAVDITYISNVWRGSIGNKGLDVDKIRANPTKILIATTDYNTGEQVLLDAKTLKDPIDALQASVAIPVLYKSPVFINGKRYVDGTVSKPLPFESVVELEKPTTILIFANRPIFFKDIFYARIYDKSSGLCLPQRLGKAMKNSQKEFNLQLELLRRSKIPYTIIWTDSEVSSLEKDPNKIRWVVECFKKYVLSIGQQ